MLWFLVIVLAALALAPMAVRVARGWCGWRGALAAIRASRGYRVRYALPSVLMVGTSAGALWTLVQGGIDFATLAVAAFALGAMVLAIAAASMPAKGQGQKGVR